MTDEEINEKVIKHDYEFQSLTKSLSDIVKELNEITASMKNVAVINETITNMDKNIKDGFVRVYGKIEGNEAEIEKLKSNQDKVGCNALRLKATEIDSLNRTVYGKDGRGGLVFDVEDIKRFMYKTMGAFTFVNMVVAIIIAFITK